MPMSELESIAGAMQDAIHRAYALGKEDALRRIVEMVKTDELGAKAIPLLGPSETHMPAEPMAMPYEEPAASEPVHAAAASHNDNATLGRTADPRPSPWYRRPIS